MQYKDSGRLIAVQELLVARGKLFGMDVNDEKRDNRTGADAESPAPGRWGSRQSAAEQLQRRMVDFGVAVCQKTRGASRDFATTHICQQMVRASTSVAANYAEARAASTPRYFQHKLQICLKELRETLVWLEMHRRNTTGDSLPSPLEFECDELIAILVRSVQTLKRRTRNPAPDDPQHL